MKSLTSYLFLHPMKYHHIVSVIIFAMVTCLFTTQALAANSAPILDSSKSPAFSSVLEDAGAPSGAVGTLVSSFIDFDVPAGQVDNISDVDGGTPGMALIGVDPSLSCYYSSNGGTTWVMIGAISDSAALVFTANGTNRIYCAAGANASGTFASAITFRAWDQSDGSSDVTLVSIASTGGTTAFSTASDTASLTVTPVNDDPTATNLSAAETYTEDTPLNLINIVVTDIDSPIVTAVLTLSDTAAGSLSTGTSGAVTSIYNAGTGVWTAAGPIADVNVLLAALVFTPANGYTSNFSIATNITDSVTTPVTGSKSFVYVANTAPIAVGDTVTVAVNSGSNNLNVLDNDSDPDTGDTYVLSSVTQPSHGTASLSANMVAYIPATDYCGSDSFTYEIEDSYGLTDQATVTVTVQCTTPSVTSTLPIDNATDVSTTTTLVINFSEPMNTGSLTIDTDNCNGTCATYDVVWSNSDQTATLTKSNGAFMAGVEYHVTILASSLNSVQMAGEYELSFTTAAPVVTPLVGGGVVVPLPVVASLGTITPTPNISVTPVNPAAPQKQVEPFLKNLRRGMDNGDVARLQAYLNTHGFPVATSGWGSRGQETTVFGAKTVRALVAFQASIGLPATGYFGPMTRAYINSHAN